MHALYCMALHPILPNSSSGFLTITLTFFSLVVLDLRDLYKQPKKEEK